MLKYMLKTKKQEVAGEFFDLLLFYFLGVIREKIN